jgi:hypothetical protein
MEKRVLSLFPYMEESARAEKQLCTKIENIFLEEYLMIPY